MTEPEAELLFAMAWSCIIPGMLSLVLILRVLVRSLTLIVREYPPAPSSSFVFRSPAFDVLKWRTWTVSWLLVASVLPLALSPLLELPLLTWLSLHPMTPELLGLCIVLFALGLIDALVLIFVYSAIVLASSMGREPKALWCLGVALGGPIAYPLAFYFLVHEPRRATSSRHGMGA